MPANPTISEAVARSVARHGGRASQLVQILREVQAELQCIPAGALDELARSLSIPRVRVESAASFYHFFHAQSHGTYEILFSDNIIDQMLGKREMMQYLCKLLWEIGRAHV